MYDEKDTVNPDGVVRAKLALDAATETELDELLTDMLIVQYPKRVSQDN
jgi:hypothetical protein